MRFFLGGLCGLALSLLAAMSAQAQTGFDRPGGDYARFTVQSGDPAMCSARCDRDARRCRMLWITNRKTRQVAGAA